MSAPAVPWFHVKQRARVRARVRRPARDWTLVRRRARAAARRAGVNLYVTLKRVRSYALTAGALACFVVAAFTLATALGWAAAGAAALVFNWGLERDSSGG